MFVLISGICLKLLLALTFFTMPVFLYLYSFYHYEQKWYAMRYGTKKCVYFFCAFFSLISSW